MDEEANLDKIIFVIDAYHKLKCNLYLEIIMKILIKRLLRNTSSLDLTERIYINTFRNKNRVYYKL
jgi:hypothetical protein